MTIVPGRSWDDVVRSPESRLKNGCSCAECSGLVRRRRSTSCVALDAWLTSMVLVGMIVTAYAVIKTFL